MTRFSLARRLRRHLLLQRLRQLLPLRRKLRLVSPAHPWCLAYPPPQRLLLLRLLRPLPRPYPRLR